MLYFAYGSNLNVGQMSLRCPSAEKLNQAKLLDWAMIYSSNGGLGYCNIVPSKGAVVYGGLWELSADCESSLDRYEDYPSMYTKGQLQVLTLDGSEVEALTYWMTDGHFPMYPKGQYLDTVLQGYRDFGITARLK